MVVLNDVTMQGEEGVEEVRIDSGIPTVSKISNYVTRSLRENSVLWCFFDEPHVEGNFNQTESIEKHKVEIYVTIA